MKVKVIFEYEEENDPEYRKHLLEHPGEAVDNVVEMIDTGFPGSIIVIVDDEERKVKPI